MDPRRIAAEAEVDVIVAGTLLHAADGIRVSSQLTDASTGTLLWSYTTQVPVGDLFQVQDELVHRIIDSLSLPLTARERRMIRNDVPSSKRAYEDFLRANRSASIRSDGVWRAICTSDASKTIRAMPGVGAPGQNSSCDGEVPRDWRT